MLGAAGMVLGSNIGTCVTALLAASGRGREARRLAIFHLMFNILGVAWLFPGSDSCYGCVAGTSWPGAVPG